MDNIALQRRVEELERRVEEGDQRLAETAADLREAREQLAQRDRMAMLGCIAAGIGHELRQPLSVINNIAYCLRLMGADRTLPSAAGATAHAHLGRLEEQVALANRIISNLMDFVRRQQPNRSAVQLNALLEAEAAGLQPPENIRVEKDLAPELPPILADPFHVQRVLHNLALNALQSMGQSGGCLLLRTAAENNDVLLEVKDTGPGIREEIRDKIFQPFFSTKSGGLGLGLALSRHLVEANQGTIHFCSTPGQGASFQVRFPASR